MIRFDHKLPVQFFVVALSAFIAWTLIYGYFLRDDGRLDLFLSYSQTEVASELLKLIGFNNTKVIDCGVQACISIDGLKKVAVGGACNGLILLVTYTIFILAFPSRLLPKLVFIPSGILLIMLANIIRIASLALINMYYPAALDFNHKYVFTLFVYADIFIIWLVFINRYSAIAKRAK